MRNAASDRSRAYRAPEQAMRGQTVRLPATGSELPVPPIPASAENLWDQEQRERWEDLWTSPQATMWDSTCVGTVVQLITFERAIMEGTAMSWQGLECRHAGEALGLTPKSMAALNWIIVEDQ